MPAVSKTQQRLMGMTHAYEKGELDISKLPKGLQDKIKDIAKTMKDKDTKDFAKTKQAGLPEKIPENAILDENTVEDLPDDVEYGYTKDGVVQCIASKNTCMTRMKTDRERNPGSKFQFIYSPTLEIGDEIEIEEIVEGGFQDSIASDARGLTYGTLSSLTGEKDKKKVQKIQNDFVKFAMNNKSKYKEWYKAWEGFWKKDEDVNEVKWINFAKAYPKDDISVGTRVKILYGKHKGKMGVVSDDAPAHGFAIVKVGKESGYINNADLLVKEVKMKKAVRSASDKEYKIAQTFAKKIGMELDSIGVQKNGNINIKGDVNLRPVEMVINKYGKVVKGHNENEMNEVKKINKSQIKKGMRINFQNQEGFVTKVTPKGFEWEGDDYGATISATWAELSKGYWKLDENMNEVKSDKDMVKDGLRYAKKKYKYNAKEMKELASDTLQYIKSGEIDDQASMEAYIDFRNDEMSEACKKDKLKETIRSIVKEIL